jgi:hypothetical protein
VQRRWSKRSRCAPKARDAQARQMERQGLQ